MAVKRLGKISKRTSHLLVRAAVVIVAFVGVSAYLLSGIADADLFDLTPYFLVAILLQLVPFLVRHEADPFEPVGLTCIMTLAALVPGLAAYLANGGVQISLLPQVTGRVRVELMQTVMMAYMLGTVSYFLGYYTSFGTRLTRIFPDVAGGVWRRNRIIHVCAVGFAIFIPAYAYFQSRVGVRLTDATQLAAGKAVWREDGTLTWMIRAIALGFVPVLFIVSLNFPKLRWGRAIATLGLVGVVSLLSVRLGQRGTAIYCFLNVLIVVHYLGRRIPLGVLAGLGFGLLVITNLLGDYRKTSASSVTATSVGPTANFNVQETVVEHEEDRERMAAMAVVFYYFPERKDYLMGESWGPILLAFIPRWLWPEKGYYFVWRETSIVLQLTGSPTPVGYLALLYANFSWIGIFIGMFGLGVFQRGLYEWLQKNSKDKSIVLLYSGYVVYVGPTMLQVSAAIGFVLPIYVAIRYMRVAPKRPRLIARGPQPAALLPAAPAGAPESIARATESTP